MILEGIKLTFLGMSFVFIFLTLLLFSIFLLGKIFKEDPPPFISSVNETLDLKLKAIITAAIHQHRNNK